MCGTQPCQSLVQALRHVAVGMHRHGFDLQLTEYGRARLARDVLHDRHGDSPTSTTGTGWERTPWHATQPAAWGALKKKPESESG
jgi:hypothetical protein